MGFIWTIVAASRISNRAQLLEIAVETHDKRLEKLEKATSYTEIEKIVERVCVHIFYSKDFKETMKDSVKETILHVEKNRSSAQAGAFEEILNELKEIKQNK